MILPTLYAYDTKGKIRQWDCYSEDDTVIVTHGVKDGKMQEKRTVCKPKNIGKTNETNSVQQAELEAKAKWTKQIEREDYAEDVKMSGRQLRPMLALDYNKVPHRVDWDDAYAQPKLDGLRLTAGSRFHNIEDSTGKHELMTRKGEIYDIPHLMDATKLLLEIVNEMCDNRCVALDGEAYIHGMPLQQITSLARKNQNGSDELVYMLFDLVIKDMSFHERYSLLECALAEYNKRNYPFISELFLLVPLQKISSIDIMKDIHGIYTEQGYEGLMIRHGGSNYLMGRSPNLFKYKHFKDTEAKIIELWKDKNQNAMLICQLKNGLTCKVTPKRTHEERKQMLAEADSYIGKWITVKYQANTDDGNLQFPVGLALRECDDDGNPLV